MLLRWLARCCRASDVSHCAVEPVTSRIVVVSHAVRVPGEVADDLAVDPAGAVATGHVVEQRAEHACGGQHGELDGWGEAEGVAGPEPVAEHGALGGGSGG